MITIVFNLELYSFTGYCTGSTEAGVTGGSTGSAVKHLVGGSTMVGLGLQLDCACSSLSAAVARKLRRRFLHSTVPLTDSTLYERGCWHFQQYSQVPIAE